MRSSRLDRLLVGFLSVTVVVVRDVRQLGCLRHGVVLGADLVGKAVLDCRHAGERETRGQRAHVFDGHVATLGHGLDECLVDLVDLILVVGALLLGERARAVAGILAVGAGDVVHRDAQLLHEAGQVGNLHDRADGADGRGLGRVDIVGLRGYLIGGARIDGRAGHHDRLAGALGEPAHVVGHLLARRSRAAAGVHTQYDGLDMAVLLGAIELGLQAFGAGGGVVVLDGAVDVDDADRVAVR